MRRNPTSEGNSLRRIDNKTVEDILICLHIFLCLWKKFAQNVSKLQVFLAEYDNLTKLFLIFFTSVMLWTWSLWKKFAKNVSKLQVFLAEYDNLTKLICSFDTQSPLIRTTAKWPELEVLKNSSDLDTQCFLTLQAWALAVS